MPLSKLFIAIFLNIAVMPGAGQMYIKEKSRGWLFVFLIVVLVLTFTVQISGIMREAIGSADLTGDITKMATAMSAQIMEDHGLFFKIYEFLLGTIYIASITDVVLIYFGKSHTQNQI